MLALDFRARADREDSAVLDRKGFGRRLCVVQGDDLTTGEDDVGALRGVGSRRR